MAVYERLMQELSSRHVKLVAVSKTFPPEDILSLYQKGQRDFGENYVQELLHKQAQLPGDIRWHFIGHLQTNKVKYLAPFIHCIQSVDSLRLLQEIHKQAQKHQRTIPVLLQIHIAQESTKFGLDEASLKALLEQSHHYPGASIVGLMGMASLTADERRIREEFRYLKHLFDRIKTSYFPDDPNFCELSMGMSSDYALAIEEGSTLVRIGSLIFGARAKK